MQNIPSTSESGPAHSNLEARIETISDRIDGIHGELLRQIEDKLGTLIDQVKSKIGERSGRSLIPSQCTPWRHWKAEACSIIGT